MATLSSLAKKLRDAFDETKADSPAQKFWAGNYSNPLINTQKFFEGQGRITLPKFDNKKARSIPLNMGVGFAEAAVNEPKRLISDIGTGIGKTISGQNFDPTSSTMKLTNNVMGAIQQKQNPLSTVKINGLKGYGKGNWNVPFTGINLPEMGFSESQAAKMTGQAFGVAEPFLAIKGAAKPLLAGGYTALGGGMNALLGDRNQSLEQRFVQGANEIAPKSVVSAGYLAKTNPLLDKIGGGAMTRLPLKSGANVIQGLGQDQAAGFETTPEGILLDAIFPIAGEMGTKTFKSAQDAMRNVDMKLKQAMGTRLRNNKGFYTTADKFAKGTRAYRKSGKQMNGAALGFEPYQDEQGNWKVRFNKERALVGLGAGMGLSKAVRGGNIKDLESSLNKTQFKSLDEATKRSVLEEAERMLAGGLGDVGTIKTGDTGFKYSSNPDWYRDFYKQAGKAPSNEEFFDIALSRVKPQQGADNIDDVMKNLLADDVPSKGVSPKQIDPLIQEARKYKSAEEFVKSQASKDGVATRFGDIDKNGAYFSAQNEGFTNPNYFNAKTATAKNAQYDIGSAKVVESGTPDALEVLKKAAKDPSNTTQQRNILLRELSNPDNATAALIDWRMNDEIPSIVRAAKSLGFDGIKVIETGDVNKPTSMFIWNTGKVRELQTKSQLTDIWNKVNQQPINSPYSMGIVGNTPTKNIQPQELPTKGIGVQKPQEGLSIPRTDMQKFDPNRISSNVILALEGKSRGVAGETFNIQDLNQPVDRKQGIKLSKQLIKEDQKATIRLSRQNIKDSADIIAKSIRDNTSSKVQKEVKASGGVLSNSRAWKDKAKLLLKRETMERNFEDIMGADAPKMKKIYIDPIKRSEADRMRFLNKERSDIAKLGIAPKSKESELLQRFGEKQIDAATLKKQAPESYEKIMKAEKIFREKYDKYLTDINLALTRNGYDPIPKRKDYFRHFNEVGSVLEQFGIPVKDDLIPTDIVGLTADFKPGKNFFASALPRLGKMTEVDAIRGIDKYLDGASNQIYHTDNIQRMRGLERSLRDIHAGTGQLSNFTAELMEYTNKLAGKKSMIDRGAEDLVGRKFYSGANFLKRQTGSNMVGLNVASALTNFIPFTQSLATTDKDAAIQGLAQAMKNVYRNDGFIKKSDFLTSRFGADPLFRTTWENAQDKGFYLMKVADKFVSESIVRGKYLEGLKKGMGDSEAIKYADDYAGKLLANRSKGMMPTLFESQTLGALTQFQLEVNNQLSFMFKDIPRMYDKKGAASALAQVFLYSYMFNGAFEKVTGRRPAFDPIGVALDTYEDYTNEDMKDGQATKNLIGNVANQLPFASVMTGGRVPLANVLPNPVAIATGDSTLKKEASDMFFGLVPPTAGNQLRKTLQGVQSYKQGGSETPSGRIRFPIEQTPANLARTALFGQYSVPEARPYFREGRTTLGEKQSEEFRNATSKGDYYNSVLQGREENKQNEVVRERVGQTGQEETSNGRLYYMGNETDSKTGEVKRVVKSLEVGDIENKGTGLGKYVITTESGNKALVDLTKPIDKPETTGQKSLDKELISRYNSAITTRINNIEKVYLDGQITAEEAEKAINDLLTQKISTAKKKKGTKVSAPKISAPSGRIISASKPSALSTPKPIKFKSMPKAKINLSKPKSIKIARKQYAKGKPVKFKNTLGESLTKLV